MRRAVSSSAARSKTAMVRMKDTAGRDRLKIYVDSLGVARDFWMKMERSSIACPSSEGPK